MLSHHLAGLVCEGMGDGSVFTFAYRTECWAKWIRSYRTICRNTIWRYTISHCRVNETIWSQCTMYHTICFEHILTKRGLNCSVARRKAFGYVTRIVCCICTNTYTDMRNYLRQTL